MRLLFVASCAWLVFRAVQAGMRLRFDARKTVFALVTAGMFYAALSLVCHVFIRLMSTRDDRLTTRSFTELSGPCRTGIRDMLAGTSINLYDKDVGWVPRPGFREEGCTISPQGLRGTREYPDPAPDAAKRVLCMGDSFTFGFAVKDEETYPYHAEQMRPGTEWLNLGISRTRLAQSLLHYRKTGRELGGKYVVIGFMTNDAPRTVNCFRPFVSPDDAGHPFTKPYARFGGSRFSIEPNPYQEIGAFHRLLANEQAEIAKLRGMDYLTWSNQQAETNPILRTMSYVQESLSLDRNIDLMLNRKPAKGSPPRQQAATDPYGRGIWDPAGAGFKAVIRVMDRYHDEVVADGREPLIVIIPGPLDLDDYKRSLPRKYAPLLEHLKSKGWRHLDFLDPLVEKHKSDLSHGAIFTRLHYVGPVNRLLAGEIVRALGI